MSCCFFCDANNSKLSQLISILDNNGNIILGQQNTAISTIDDLVNGSGLSSTNDVNNAIQSVENGIIGIIPDYTNRLNNTGSALDKFDEDFEEFKKTLEECQASKAKDFLQLLDLGIDFPDLPDIDFPFFGSQEIREALRNITGFPLRYLSSIKENILQSVIEGIKDLSGRLSEFDIGNDFDLLDQDITKNILNIAKEIEYIYNCARKLACSDIVNTISDYENIMNSLPLDPVFNFNNTDKLIPLPNYKLNTDTVLNNTIANSTQIQNIKNTKESFTKSMDYARFLTSKF